MTDQDQHLIDAFIRENLTEEQKQLLQQRLKDPAFAESFALQTQLIEGLEEQEQDELKSKFKEVLRNQETNPGKNRWKYLFLAFILLLLTLFFFKSKIWTGQAKEEKLFTEFYSPLPPLNINRGDTANPEYIKALKTYQDENYEAALVQFMNLLEESPSNLSYQLYGGIAALALNQTDQSSSMLTQVWVLGDDFLSQHAEWYYCLTLLRKGNLEDAKSQAQQIANNPDQLYRKMAALLVKELP